MAAAVAGGHVLGHVGQQITYAPGYNNLNPYVWSTPFSVGPGVAHMKPQPDGSMPNPNNPYEEFFGPPAKPFGRETMSRENFDIQDAYTGSNNYLSKVVITNVTKEDTFWCNEILPWVKTEDKDQISWSVVKFHDHLLNRRPAESVSRLLSFNQVEKTTSFVSYGIAMILEHDFYKTEKGKKWYAFHLKQMSNATAETASLGAALELLNAPAGGKSFAERNKMGMTRHMFYKYLEQEISMFQIMQDTEGGTDIAFQTLRKQMQQQGFEPNTVILPDGSVDMVRQSRIELNNYLYSGKPNDASGSGSSSGSLIKGGMRQFKSRPFRLGENRPNWDPFFQVHTIGSHYKMLARDTYHIPVDKYRTVDRSIYAWDEDQDNWHLHTLEDVLGYSGLLPPRGGMQMPKLGLEVINAMGGDSNGSWYDFIEEMGYTDRIARAIGVKKRYDSLRQFVYGAAARRNGRGAGRRDRGDNGDDDVLANPASASGAPKPNPGSGSGRTAAGEQDFISPAREVDARGVDDGNDFFDNVTGVDPAGSKEKSKKKSSSKSKNKDKAWKEFNEKMESLIKKYGDDDTKANWDTLNDTQKTATGKGLVLKAEVEPKSDTGDAYLAAARDPAVANYIAGKGSAGGAAMDDEDEDAADGNRGDGGAGGASVRQLLRQLSVADRPDFLLWLCRNDIPVPISFLLSTPHMRFQCGAMIACQRGAELGQTHYGFPDFQMSSNANQKMFFGHLTLKLKSKVYDNDRIAIARSVFVNDYLGGAGSKYWNPNEDTEIYADDDLDHASMFVFAVKPGFKGRKFMDITGKFDPKALMEDQDHTSTAEVYSKHWGFAHEFEGDEYNPYDGFGPNTLTVEGAQINRGASGEFNRYTINKGHLSERIYPGCARVRKGRAIALKPINYTETATIAVIP